jgi:dipeptidyl aminopeptidase/acylaminoacyl peptidase
VWTISANGGVPQQVTTEAGDQVRPSWSRDGHWIYFVWKRAHDRDVWRRRLPAGPVERVTQGGSSMRAASESVDGTGVWYKHEQADGPLLFQPLAGGAARAVIPCVSGPRFFIGVDGVYYMPCRPAGDTSHDAPVRVHRLATGEDRQFATLTGVRGPAGTLTSFVVSPNGRTLLYNRLASREADLMLIERFR